MLNKIREVLFRLFFGKDALTFIKTNIIITSHFQEQLDHQQQQITDTINVVVQISNAVKRMREEMNASGELLLSHAQTLVEISHYLSNTNNRSILADDKNKLN